MGLPLRLMVGLLAFAVMTVACTGEAIKSTTSETSPSNGGVASPPPPAPIAPVLRQAGPPGEMHVGFPNSLGVLVLAENPISRIEIWDGSELEASVEYDEPTTDLRTGFDWTPDTAGLHALTLRAFDSNGGVATSFPLWARAIEALETESSESTRLIAGLAPIEVAMPLATNALQPGPSLAAVVDADTCQAAIKLPAVQGAGTVLYATAMGGTGFVPVGNVGPDGGTLNVAIGASPLLVYAESYQGVEQNPGPPNLLVSPDQCMERGWSGDAQLIGGFLPNAHGADSAYLYISSDGGEVWDRAPATDQTFVYPGTDGQFDFSGLLPSSADVGQPVLFEAWGWVDGTLTPLGRGAWRQPATEEESLGGDVLVGNFGGTLVADADLDWVVNQDGPVLVRSGTICTYPQPTIPGTTTTTVPVTVIGGTVVTPTTQPAGTAIAAYPDSCTNEPFGGAYSETFRWKPVFGGFDKGLVQVSRLPIPDASVANFPGLVYSKVIDMPTSGFVDFEIPIGEILDPPPQTGVLPDKSSMTYQVFENLLLAGSGNADSEGVSLAIPSTLAVAGTPALYIKVVPANGTTLLPGDSNIVKIKIDDTPSGKLKLPPPPPGMSLEVTMSPPSLPNPSYQRCVRVIENPFGSKNPAPSTTPWWFALRGEIVPGPGSVDSWYGEMEKAAFIFENGSKVEKGMVEGSTVCAWQADPPSKQWWEYIEDAINFVGMVWDQYVTVFDMLKSWVADVMAQVSGCALLAEATGKSEAEAEKVCAGLAKTAINTALIAYGVPPTLPKFAEFAELGKGELKSYLIDQAFTQTGIDCSVLQDECEKMLDKLIGKMIDEMQYAASKAAVQSATVGSQWVMAIHPAIKVIPEPAGGPPTAIFSIKVTRSTEAKAAPLPDSCTYTASVFGEKAWYEWQNYETNQWQTGPISGGVMVSGKLNLDLSDLAPGESTGGQIVLDKMADFYLPGQNPWYDPVPWNMGSSKSWIFLLDYGVTAETNPLTTLSLSLNGGPECGGAISTFTQDHVYTEPYDILPYP